MSKNFEFEHILDRRKSDSIKWRRYAGRNILPMWVADMDFASAPAIIEALHKRVEHGCFGYGSPWPELLDSVTSYAARRYDWQINPEWIVWLPGLVVGINLACRSVAGDALTATPVYPPFLSAPGLAGHALTSADLSCQNACWTWDFDALEQALTDKTKLFLLCHPHNPVGRAWNEDELKAVSAFCQKHDLIVCSDEIHCDLVLEEGIRHRPLASLDNDIAQRSITLMAPSKTYNIPGLGCSFAVIPNPEIRKRFVHAARGIVPDVNILGLHAAQAALTQCDDWHSALLDVLRENRKLVEAAVSAAPLLSMTHIEATYLAWIDARNLNHPDPAAFFEEAGVGLSNGKDFGAPGWVRLNFGCPQSTLESALELMHDACTRR